MDDLISWSVPVHSTLDLISEAEANSANTWIVSPCIVVVTLRVPIVSGPRIGERVKVGLGACLLVSPVALGFAGSGAAWNAWIVGALIPLAIVAINGWNRIASGFRPVPGVYE